MLRELDLRDLTEKYRLAPRGLINVGAFSTKELPIFNEVGFSPIMLIEANPDLFDALADFAYVTSQEVNVINALVSDDHYESHPFYLCKEHLQSSSLLKFKKHGDYHPEVSMETETIELPGTMLDTIFNYQVDAFGVLQYSCKANAFDINRYNTLLMDVQGAELKVLEGFSDHIWYMDYIYTEIHFDELYEGCVLEDELTEYLWGKEFTKIESFDTGHGWGDALYVRS